MKDIKQEYCPVTGILWQMWKQWMLLIIYKIGSGERFFSQLKNSLEGISSRTLSLKLKELQRDWFIKRAIVSEQPIRIEYNLTEKGESFKSQVDNLWNWWKEWA